MTALSILFGFLMFATALFLILLVLVQRGRVGGLSGALGGMGGHIAFGTNAGDLFTRITIFVAAFWILLCIAAILVLNRQTPIDAGPAGDGPGYTTVDSGAGDADDDSATDTGAAGTGTSGGLAEDPGTVE